MKIKNLETGDPLTCDSCKEENFEHIVEHDPPNREYKYFNFVCSNRECGLDNIKRFREVVKLEVRL